MRPLKAAVLLLASLTVLSAQETPSTSSVPRLIRISNAFRPANRQPPERIEGATLFIYRDEQGGAPLWQETQNVGLDAEGRYSVLLGSTLNDGLPAELFSTGEPRWLGVQFNRPGEVEQPRVRLASVPYAMKAADAETLGGLPLSAFLLDPSALTNAVPGSVAVSSIARAGAKALQPRLTSGLTNCIGKFINSTDLGCAVISDTNGFVDVGTSGTAVRFFVRINDSSGAFTGYSVQNTASGSAAYSGMLFFDQNGSLAQFQGFNNATHEYRINNIASSGSINFMLGGSSKFLVRSDGDVDMSGNLRKSGALFFHNLGTDSTALGLGALIANTGSGNTAVGRLAMVSTTGNDNTAVGSGAMFSNTTGFWNVAVGSQALNTNTTGVQNVAVGRRALLSSTVANNVAVGFEAMAADTTGGGNTAVGFSALTGNTTGNANIAIGFQAGVNVVAGNNNIYLGGQGLGDESNTVRIGNPIVQTSFFVAGTRGVTTGSNNAIPVLIDSNGQLGTVSSSRRFKEEIHDMGEASSGLMQLRPVTFRHKKPFADGSKPIQYGLIAEEVAEVYPDLVARSADGQIETVKYQVLPTMLLNEVQRQQSEIRGQADQIRALEQKNHALQERLVKLEAALSSNQGTNPR